MSMLTIGIAGTAKNTGKTTTLSALLEEIKKEAARTLALTSIGYDGESFDNVTGLPKPRIHVWPGNIVAIAERCVPFSFATMEPLLKTGIRTPLGMIVLYRVTKPGKVVLAGPNNRRDLRTVLDHLAQQGADLTIVDGALGRIAPMVETDGLLLATGAARYTDIPRLAGECADMLGILDTPVCAPRGDTARIVSVMNRAGFDELLQKLRAADTVEVQGIVSERYLAELAGLPEDWAGKCLLFADPIKLLLSGEIGSMHRILEQLAGRSICVGVGRAVPPLAVTVNPYYPLYRYNSRDYEPGYVDADELLAQVSAGTDIPCYDVLRQGGEALFRRVIAHGKSLGAIG